MTTDTMERRITQVGYCALGLDDFEAYSWTVSVEWRGPGDLYAVVNRGRNLSRSGKWAYESMPSSRTNRFKQSHRFPFKEACELAEKHARKIKVMGKTAADVVAWREEVSK